VGIAANTPFVSINPASAKVIKQWDARNYAALMDKLRRDDGLTSVLVTADKAVAAQVAAAAQEPFVNLCGRTTLKQLAEVLRRSAVHVCGDTGSAHIAAALERPAVTLVGPTDPDRICPYRQRDNVLSHRELCGKRCDWHHCEFARPRCLDAITVDDVHAKILLNLGLEE
jgi:ADP-heptose:LPS heptosyltransferase